MRHAMRQRKLGRTSAHRLALFRNQLASLVRSERIVTTLPKAKELRPIAERVVTLGKRSSVHARRLAQRWLPDRELIKKLFDDIAPRMGTRPGGYLRIVKLGPRLGDAAEMAVLEFVDFQPAVKETKDAGTGKKAKGEEAAGAAGEEGAEGEAKPKEKAAKADRKAARAEGKAKTQTKGKTPHHAKTSTTRKVGGS